jgi:hypothetical protein
MQSRLKERLLTNHALALSRTLEPRVQTLIMEFVIARRTGEARYTHVLGMQDRITDGTRLDTFEFLLDIALPQ